MWQSLDINFQKFVHFYNTVVNVCDTRYKAFCVQYAPKYRAELGTVNNKYFGFLRKLKMH